MIILDLMTACSTWYEKYNHLLNWKIEAKINSIKLDYEHIMTVIYSQHTISEAKCLCKLKQMYQIKIIDQCCHNYAYFMRASDDAMHENNLADISDVVRTQHDTCDTKFIANVMHG